MTQLRLLLVPAAMIAIVSAAEPARGGDEQDCFQGQEPELRIRGCSALIERAPNDTAGYHNRAVAYSAAGDMDKAIADYTKVIEIAPENASAYDNRSRALASRGDYSQAAADKTRAQELIARTIAQPTNVTRKGNILPSEAQTVESPSKATPTRNAKPPLPALKAVPPVKAGSPLKTETVLKAEPASKASNSVATEGPGSSFWSWLNGLGGKKEPPRKAAPAVKVEPASKVEPALKGEPPVKAVPALKVEPPVKAVPALKVEPAPKTEPTPKVEPTPDNGVDQEAPPDTFLAWLNQINGKKTKP
ncbi:MAG TPA: tetratricopeptide repeat protein [Hyphomicrobiaceae bacterium]|nr:tetratricopeptide repeat protein [Hyphomicrobiaceae bacterium]